VLIAALLAAYFFSRGKPGPVAARPTPSSPPAALDLSGTWTAEVSKDLPGDPPRPALKEVSLESERQGGIVAARVVLTDPGRGGAGAGYRMARDGPARLARVLSALDASPRGAELEPDFVSLPGWVPARRRLWKVLEGGGARAGRTGRSVRYVLLESVEDDYLIQAGVNASGFLSYAFFSPAYAAGRGEDVLSRVIHPEPGSSLRGFRNLVWDLSGSADFLTLTIPALVSGPEGGAADRITLTRKNP
jgi:hypothetical protein